MNLSKITFHLENLTNLRAIGCPDALHKLIWKAFPEKNDGGPGRILFRLDLKRDHASVLVQSEKKPVWEKPLAEGAEFDYLTKILKISPANGKRYSFRLRANPTKKIKKQEDESKRRRVGLFKEEEQLQWLARKADLSGFKVLGVSAMAKEDQKSRFRKNRITHLAVTFDGTLEVTDSTKFKDALANGIGSAKAFGFGLLSLAPA